MRRPLWTRIAVLVTAILISGCGDEKPKAEPSPSPPPTLGHDFETGVEEALDVDVWNVLPSDFPPAVALPSNAEIVRVIEHKGPPQGFLVDFRVLEPQASVRAFFESNLTAPSPGLLPYGQTNSYGRTGLLLARDDLSVILTFVEADHAGTSTVELIVVEEKLKP